MTTQSPDRAADLAREKIAQEKLAHARAVADTIRADWPEKAAEIDRALDQVAAGQRDGLTVSTSIRFKLEKFDGPIVPGKQPFETIEGQG